MAGWAQWAGLSSVTRHQHSTLDSWSVASNFKLHHLDKVPTHRCRKKYWRSEDVSPDTPVFLCPNYLLVLLTDDDDDDNDVDEWWWHYWVTLLVTHREWESVVFCSTCTMSSLKSSRSLSHLLMSFLSRCVMLRHETLHRSRRTQVLDAHVWAAHARYDAAAVCCGIHVDSIRIVLYYAKRQHIKHTGWLKKVSCWHSTTAYFFEPPCTCDTSMFSARLLRTQWIWLDSRTTYETS